MALLEAIAGFEGWVFGSLPSSDANLIFFNQNFAGGVWLLWALEGVTPPGQREQRAWLTGNDK